MTIEGGQISLDPGSNAAAGARGVHGSLMENLRLRHAGYTELGLDPDDPVGPPIHAPINSAVPYVSQAGATLNCTMGEWMGEPTSYSYQWQLDGVNAGTDAADYAVVPEDVGKGATCVVTATNDVGAMAAPVSNTVVVA